MRACGRESLLQSQLSRTRLLIFRHRVQDSFPILSKVQRSRDVAG